MTPNDPNVTGFILAPPTLQNLPPTVGVVGNILVPQPTVQNLPPTVQSNAQMAANAYENMYKPIAAYHNQVVEADYTNSLTAATESTANGFPTVLPMPPIFWIADYDGILAAYDAVAAGQTPNWQAVFDYVPYVPLQPAPPAPPALTLGEETDTPGVFEMSGDGPRIPVGTRVNINGQEYQKIPYATNPMGPVFAWQQVK